MGEFKLACEKKDLKIVVVGLGYVGHNCYRDIKIEQLRKICPNKNAILGDLKSLYDKQKLIDSGFEVFRL